LFHAPAKSQRHAERLSEIYSAIREITR